LSFLLSCVLLFWPLFNGQIESFNMEPPLLMFGILAVYYLVEKKMWKAALMANLAAAVKGSGLFVSGVVFFIAICLFLFDKKYRFKLSVFLAGLFSLTFLMLKTYASMFLVYAKGEGMSGLVGWLIGQHPLRNMLSSYVFIVMLSFAFLIVIIELIKKRTFKLTNLNEHYLGFIIFSFSASWYGLHLHMSSILDRYLLILIPGFILCAFYIIEYFIKNKKVLNFTLIITILFLMTNSYGFGKTQFKPGEPWVRRANLSYRTGIKMQINMSKYIENNFNNYKLVAPFTIAQKIAMPENGYISKKLNVYVFGHPCTYGDIQLYPGLSSLNMSNTIFLGYPTQRFFGEQDRIIKRFEYSDRWGVIFQGGFEVEKAYRRMIYNLLLKNKKPLQ